MSIVKIQRKAKNRMKLTTGEFAGKKIGAVRFALTYYPNLLLGFSLAIAGVVGGRFGMK
jgi:hypothetical protein